MATQLQVRLLGPPSIYLNGERCRILYRQAAAALYFLILNPGEQNRLQLALSLWPDHHSPRSRLAHALHHLRQALSPPSDAGAGQRLIQLTRHSVRFCLGENDSVDVLDFQRLWEEARAVPVLGPQEREKLSRAVELYKGPLLEGFLLDDACGEFNDWIVLRQQETAHSYLAALRALTVCAVACGEHNQALDWLARYFRAEPYDEPLHALAMLLYVAHGDPQEALRHYDRYREVLEDSVGSDLGLSAAGVKQLIAARQLSPAAMADSLHAVLADARLDAQPNMSALVGQMLARLNLDIQPLESQSLLAVLRRAQHIAQAMGMPCFGGGHLFLALLELRDGAANQLLFDLRLRRQQVEEALRSVLGRGEALSRGEVKPTPRCQHVLDIARQRALQSRVAEIETHHLLEALLLDYQGVVFRVLEQLGATRAALYRVVARR